MRTFRLDHSTKSGSFFLQSMRAIGHERNIKHLAVAYDCLRHYVDAKEISLETIALTDSYNADYFACQMAHGDTQMLFGLSGSKHAMLNLAGSLASESYEDVNEDSYDAMCEFTNLVNGSYVGVLEGDDEEMDLVPPVCCENCHITTNGQFCVLSLLLDGEQLDMISVIDIIPYMK